jgi:nitroreductase
MNEIYSRVSIRKFADQQVERDKILAVLRAAMQAPSAHNQQPWEFYVISDKNMLEKLSHISKYSMCIKNAPVAIVSAYRTDPSLPSPKFCLVDMSIAMENLWLEVTHQGLGGVWIGTAPNEEIMQAVEEIIGIPEDQRAFAVFPFGYPAQEKEQQDRFDRSRIHWL